MKGSQSKIVVTGDSIISALTVDVFNEAIEKFHLPLTFSENLDTPDSIAFINTGIGGRTIEVIEMRLERDTLSLNPDIVICNGGTNDLWGYNTTGEIYLNSWRNILEMCKRKNIRCGALAITPATAFSDEIMEKRDSWNRSLDYLVEEFDGLHFYIDAGEAVGMPREGYDTAVPCDIRPDCDLDGVHFSRHGSIQLAQTIIINILTHTKLLSG